MSLKSVRFFQSTTKFGTSGVSMSQIRRCLSSSPLSTRLLLVLGAEENLGKKNDNSNGQTNTAAAMNRHPLLLPRVYRDSSAAAASMFTVSTVESIINAVHDHYQRDTHFVGGMGEADEGVWFAAAELINDNNHHNCKDALDYAALIQESIGEIKQSRHGVPFGVYTSGIVLNESNVLAQLPEIGIDTIEVSLFAATPNTYKQATGADHFNQVCSFIVNAAEQDMAVEVGVLKAHASAARDLALSLGARHVHVYDDE